jgi:hypothetical protein
MIWARTASPSMLSLTTYTKMPAGDTKDKTSFIITALRPSAPSNQILKRLSIIITKWKL